MTSSPVSIPLTLQEQIRQDLYHQIKSGRYKPGDKIPSEPQLVQMYQVSRVTVRNAIQQLVDENLLIKKHGKGTYVKNLQYTEGYFSGGSFTETCIQMKAKPSTRIISVEKRKYDEAIQKTLSATGDIICIKRVRCVDDTPCIIELDYFPGEFDFLMTTPLEDVSLIRLLTEEQNIALSYTEDEFNIIFAGREFSKLLNISTGTPLLEITQQVFSPEDKIIYMNKQYVLTSKYTYVVRSNK